MVGSISLTSEVSLLLLVPASNHQFQIKCAKNSLRYQVALILAICRSEKPQELVEQSRLGLALQRGQTKEIGLTDRTSDAESLFVVMPQSLRHVTLCFILSFLFRRFRLRTLGWRR